MLGGGGDAGTLEEDYHLSTSPHAGDEDAPVALVAFESPACTSCRQFHLPRHGQPSTIDRIFERYVDTGQVLYLEKYTRAGYPWETTGAHGQKCAWNQGGWETFSSLTQHFYDDQHSVSSGNVVTFMDQWASREPGLDTADFSACVREQRHSDEITQDLGDSEVAGVRGTPTFILVGHDGTSRTLPLGEFGSFANAIESALADARAADAAANETADDGANETTDESNTTTNDTSAPRENQARQAGEDER